MAAGRVVSHVIDNGNQIWVRIRDNKITNGGINNPPKLWYPETGYCAPSKPYYQNKP